MLILYVNHEILKQVSSAPKGGLISESLHVGFNLPKNVPNTILSIFFFIKWIELRIVIYWEIGAEMQKLSEIKPYLEYLDMYIFLKINFG